MGYNVRNEIRIEKGVMNARPPFFYCRKTGAVQGVALPIQATSSIAKPLSKSEHVISETIIASQI